MNLQRTPLGGGFAAGLSGSQPNLTLSSDLDNAQITFRNKRKLSNGNDYIVSELGDLKKQMSEMMYVLTTNSNIQTENMNKLCEDVSNIKSQVADIRSSIDSMTAEQNLLKTEVNSLVVSITATDARVGQLEMDMKLLKTSDSQDLSSITYENLIAECSERFTRAKNIIIAGVPEAGPDSPEHDCQEIAKITKAIFSECPQPERYFRLGQSQENKARLLKVCFATADHAKYLLRNKNKANLSNHIKIYSDQTPCQQEALRNLSKKLEQRISNGEVNLRIGYVKGVPKILETHSKKSTATVSMAIDVGRSYIVSNSPNLLANRNK
jgi:HAMP domain-containing protein